MSTKFLFAHQKFTIMAKIPNETIDEYYGSTFKFWETFWNFPPKNITQAIEMKKSADLAGLEPTTFKSSAGHSSTAAAQWAAAPSGGEKTHI